MMKTNSKKANTMTKNSIAKGMEKSIQKKSIKESTQTPKEWKKTQQTHKRDAKSTNKDSTQINLGFKTADSKPQKAKMTHPKANSKTNPKETNKINTSKKMDKKISPKSEILQKSENDKKSKNYQPSKPKAESKNAISKQDSSQDSKQRISQISKENIANKQPRIPHQSLLESNISDDKKQDEKLGKLQAIIKYRFRNLALLKEALTHKSYDRTQNNERLEFLGDAVLDLIVGEYVFKKLQSSNEGELTKLRASMVNEQSFANLANAINLGDYLFLSKSEGNNNGRKKPSILSNAFEALIGAIYLDSGLENAKKLSLFLLESVYKEIDLDTLFKDYKTILQELTQSIFALTPDYQLLRAIGPDHNKEFTMAISINGEQYATAVGKSKKEAEQNCAKIAIERLKR